MLTLNIIYWSIVGVTILFFIIDGVLCEDDVLGQVLGFILFILIYEMFHMCCEYPCQLATMVGVTFLTSIPFNFYSIYSIVAELKERELKRRRGIEVKVRVKAKAKPSPPNLEFEELD